MGTPFLGYRSQDSRLLLEVGIMMVQFGVGGWLAAMLDHCQCGLVDHSGWFTVEYVLLPGRPRIK